MQRKSSDVILMDINMPGINGLQAIKEIKEEEISCGIIVLTIHEDREYLFRLCSWVLKDMCLKT